MQNIADLSQILREDEANHLKDYDTLNNVLIFDQEGVFDIWRYASSSVKKIEITELKNIELFLEKNKMSVGDICSVEEYYKIQSLGIKANSISKSLNDSYVKARFIKNSDEFEDKIFEFTVYKFSIKADYLRDGEFSESENANSKWGYGKDGKGPILLVDCKKRENKENRSCFKVVLDGPNEFPDRITPILQLSNSIDIERVEIYNDKEVSLSEIVGKTQAGWIGMEFDTDNISTFYAYALKYPNRDFDGLITIGVNFAVKAEDDFLIPIDGAFSTSVEFRVSPWIMTPNTLSSRKLYVAQAPYAYFTKDGYKSNENFIKQLKEAVGEDNVEVASKEYTRNDPWMQDEIEFGYSQKDSKLKPMDVVLNSPRNRGLNTFPILDLYDKKNMGYITLGGTGQKNSLDSFGNLEVTPPIKGYPLGRIYHGGSLDGTGREMMLAVRDFLKAQKVQEPINLYSDWLVVGHVDEFMSFVPSLKATCYNKFKLLLASPTKFMDIMQNLADEGYCKSKLFEGKKSADGSSFETSVEDILNDQVMQITNLKTQKNIDYNRKILIEELNLSEDDIIDLPACFFPDVDREGGYKVSALMPGLVNLVVYGNKLLIAKPFGPIVDGECIIEKYVRDQLEPLGLECCFINDWNAYHVMDGEVHCGTNVIREPFKYKWWEFNMSITQEFK